MGAVKSFQTGSHINKKVPEAFAQSPLPIESFLHVQTWHSKYPTSGQNYALEFNVSYAGVTGFPSTSELSTSIVGTPVLTCPAHLPRLTC